MFLKKHFSWIVRGYILLVVFLFAYSFTQVDLSLTLSRLSLWRVGETFFQYIGYFNRPLSVTLYGSLVVALLIFYGIFLSLAQDFEVSKRKIWTMIFIMVGILVWSYNAFSYDMFNYIFDAKIVTYYHQDPYQHKALDFATDPMLSFMRWTHRTYPYGPVWLGLTIPLSYIGMHFFLVTFFLFKFLAAGAYLLTLFFISKIVKKVYPSMELLSVIFFACNPLVIIECLISGHNDGVMMAFLMGGIYFLVQKRKILSMVFLLLSIGIKFSTVVLLPLFVFAFFYNKKHTQGYWTFLIISMALAMSIGMLYVSFIKENFQPWYLLYVLPLMALLARHAVIRIITFIATTCALLEYIPFLYLGNWDPPVPLLLSYMRISSVVLISFLLFCYGIKKLMSLRNS